MSAETRARLEATTEEEIQRQMAEDGDEDLDEGNPPDFRVVRPYPDPRELRQNLHMTQEEFARAFGINVWTLREWEQKKAEPEGPARTLLRVIERNPDVVRQAVSGR
ncbi:helix-turn-helix domain-containing protein [Aerophototrophica crusticola]